MSNSRRSFLKRTTIAGSTLWLAPWMLTSCEQASSDSHSEGESTAEAASTTSAGEMFFKISLAQWSLHRTIRAGELDNLDFATKTKNAFGIDAVEYVNQFFMDKAKDMDYLGQMKTRAADNGVQSLLIMIDGEGGLGDTDEAARKKAVENHYKWVEAAKFLGCHSIRVNAYGEGTSEDVAKAATQGLHELSTFAKDYDINVIVENHGGYSSDGTWLSKVIADTEMDNCGTLPDFGNFCIKGGHDNCEQEYDRYKGVTELMPHAFGVSAKSHEFNGEGVEIRTDYTKMLQIVKDAGYKGYIGIEFEGEGSEDEGIIKTRDLLVKVGQAMV